MQAILSKHPSVIELKDNDGRKLVSSRSARVAAFLSPKCSLTLACASISQSDLAEDEGVRAYLQSLDASSSSGDESDSSQLSEATTPMRMYNVAVAEEQVPKIKAGNSTDQSGLHTDELANSSNSIVKMVDRCNVAIQTGDSERAGALFKVLARAVAVRTKQLQAKEGKHAANELKLLKRLVIALQHALEKVVARSKQESTTSIPPAEKAAPAEAATGESASEAPAATEDAPASAVEEAPAVTAEAAEPPAAGKQGHAGCVPPYARGSDMSVCISSRARGHGRGR